MSFSGPGSLTWLSSAATVSEMTSIRGLTILLTGIFDSSLGISLSEVFWFKLSFSVEIS